MKQFFDVPVVRRIGARVTRRVGAPAGRRIAAVCAGAVLLAAVAAEGADTGSVPSAAGWTVSGGLALAALAVPRDRFGRTALAAVVTSCLVTLVTHRTGVHAEHTFGVVESCALLLVVARALRLRPPLRAAALAGGAVTALTVIFLRLPPAEYGRTGSFAVPVLWGAAALAAVLGLYLRLLDRFREREHETALQQQRLDYARELHDFVGHHVTAIIAQTKAVRFASAAGRPPDAGELDGMLAQIEEAGSQAMQSMRSMVAVLRDPRGPGAVAGPGAGLADLRALTARFSAAGPAAGLTLDPRLTAAELPPGIATTVHQVVREALTNVRRHAHGAKTVTVDVRLGGDTAQPVVRVSVCDDAEAASGAAATAARPGRGGRHGAGQTSGSGYGLVGLRERAAMVGGTVTAGPRPGVGWVVEADLPLPGPLPDPSSSSPRGSSASSPPGPPPLGTNAARAADTLDP
ncbi:sensor histidine kinase [Streptomyces sp. NRRL S-340]|uniref:sensor histidine kinase n=1 Tax=Streptomyces sp. NRRL S-340 TaxID=1463901 RepID=UPI0006906895|nr:histidine kinase [Streptomyces sp. NRRL S-340]